ncbi:MAG TPA: M48 family metallopeptidase [Firmicutes bacterium]|nr:M48 family metallopeptidase [Candidatus Fermentithermobacillaceae bacterium]
MIVSGIEVEILKKNIKNIYLSVLPPDGQVRVSAPRTMKDEAIRSFVARHIEWINSKKHKIKSQPRRKSHEYVSGETHYYFGKPYELELRLHNGKAQAGIAESKLILCTRPASTTEQREKTLNEWYRQELRRTLGKLLPKWENTAGVHPNEVRIKNMKTKWGTCNVQVKRIWINLQLAKKPVTCLEYVIVHELVHLLEQNHNQNFRAYMDCFLPDWEKRKTELNEFIVDDYEASSP